VSTLISTASGCCRSAHLSRIHNTLRFARFYCAKACENETANESTDSRSPRINGDDDDGDDEVIDVLERGLVSTYVLATDELAVDDVVDLLQLEFDTCSDGAMPRCVTHE
jgi:hypothetical protein